MEEKKVKYAYWLCPCDKSDVEGIQSWLEDMAAQGLYLVEDGVLCGVFTFELRQPGKAVYRLDVAQKRKPRFMDSGDELTDEEVELYRAMGWEYLVRYGDFHIYRTAERDVTELNTESQTHAITISLLKKKNRGEFLSAGVGVLIWVLFSSSFLRYGCRLAATVGLTFTFCVYGLLLWSVIVPLLRAFRYRRYEKRLLAGDTLNHRTAWKRGALRSTIKRVAPVLLCCGIVVGLLSAWVHDSKEYPNKDYPGDPPFATVADVFPGGTITEDQVWLDYGSYKTGKTAVSRNMEWNESCHVTTAEGEKYFCILRLSYHELASEWLAKGLEEDYYRYDAARYRRKRFQDLEAPDFGLDSIRVYNNYGTLCVLMRQGNRVVYAVVTLDNRSNQNQWHLWAETMAEMLK